MPEPKSLLQHVEQIDQNLKALAQENLTQIGHLADRLLRLEQIMFGEESRVEEAACAPPEIGVDPAQLDTMLRKISQARAELDQLMVDYKAFQALTEYEEGRKGTPVEEQKRERGRPRKVREVSGKTTTPRRRR